MNNKFKKTINFVLIILVFALTGSSTAYLSGVIMSALGAEPWTLFYVIGYLLFIFPLYQGLTLVYAFLLGQFDFFYVRQKKIALKVVSLLNVKKLFFPHSSEETKG
ncbi:MAG: DUF6787 family protein [Bacteroidota bacterium]